jgi:hypothetical protein
VIFNTGQIIHGMLAGYGELDRPECLEAAVRAGGWMAACQDEDGCWRRNVHNDTPHTYNTRAAWALLRTGIASGERKLARAARRNLDWALTQQTESGWYRTNGFVQGQTPFTHTIAYAIRGLLEGGLLLEEGRYLASATRAARAMAARQRPDGWLAGAFDDGWETKASYCCLTGLAQMAIVWQRLIQTQAERNLRASVDRGLSYLKRCHRIVGDGRPEDGAIAGSRPIWGQYSRFEFPNWATKFFADALMMRLADIVIPRPSKVSPQELAIEMGDRP